MADRLATLDSVASSSPGAPARCWPARPVALALIAVATCAVYATVMRGDFLWDDDDHVTRPEIRSVEGLGQIWTWPMEYLLGGRTEPATQQYYPVLHSAFWIEHRLWGDNVVGYHVVNLVLHIAAAWLAYTVVRRLRIPGAFWAAALFALHPVQVETVAWITEQKNTLSTVFYLGAMWAYLQFDDQRRGGTYCLAFVLFVLAVLSKTVTASLPAALLVIFWWQRGRISFARDVAPLLPFFLFGLAAGIGTVLIERKFLGAQGEAFYLSVFPGAEEKSLLAQVALHALLAGRVIWFYLGKLVWPADLMFMYPRWDLDPSDWSHWLFPAAVVATFMGLFLIRGRSRAPLAAWLLFVGTLFPALGFFNLAPLRFSFVADHFQYLACLAMFTLAGAALELSIERLAPASQRIGRAAAVGVLAFLGLLSFWQTAIYQDAFALYTTTIDRNPTCWMAYNNLGKLLSERGQSQDAIKNFEQAVQLKSDYAQAYYNLGTELTQYGKPQDAIPRLEEAVKLAPDFTEAKANLGQALLKSGRAADSIKLFREALRLNPNYALAHSNLGQALFELGQDQEAMEHLTEAVRLMPGSAEVQYNLGLALLQQGRVDEAFPHLDQATQLKPDYIEAWANLAGVYAAQNKSEQAIATAEKALELCRTKGQSVLAQQIDEWLRSYRAILPAGGSGAQP